MYIQFFLKVLIKVKLLINSGKKKNPMYSYEFSKVLINSEGKKKI